MWNAEATRGLFFIVSSTSSLLTTLSCIFISRSADFRADRRTKRITLPLAHTRGVMIWTVSLLKLGNLQPWLLCTTPETKNFPDIKEDWRTCFGVSIPISWASQSWSSSSLVITGVCFTSAPMPFLGSSTKSVFHGASQPMKAPVFLTEKYYHVAPSKFPTINSARFLALTTKREPLIQPSDISMAEIKEVFRTSDLWTGFVALLSLIHCLNAVTAQEVLRSVLLDFTSAIFSSVKGVANHDFPFWKLTFQCFVTFSMLFSCSCLAMHFLLIHHFGSPIQELTPWQKNSPWQLI